MFDSNPFETYEKPDWLAVTLLHPTDAVIGLSALRITWPAGATWDTDLLDSTCVSTRIRTKLISATQLQPKPKVFGRC